METINTPVNDQLIPTSNPVNVCLFVRVSKEQQQYERQISDLERSALNRGWKVIHIIANKISGAKGTNKRPDIIELLDCADKKMFDKVLVTEISRLGRNAKDIRNTIDALHRNKIAVVFQNLGGLESLDANGKESLVTNLIVLIFSELSMEERRLISERTRSSLQYIKKFKKLGRPIGSSISSKNFLMKHSDLQKDLLKGLSLSKCMKLHNVSRNTVIKVKRLCQENKF